MRLQGVVAQISNRIRFLGHVPRPEEVLPTFDIFCLTSDTEQIPNSVLEAMSAALPIVSVDVGDIGLMVAPSNQPYVVERDRIEKFASALRELADDPDRSYRFSSENRIQVEAHFEQERMFQEYEQLLLGNVAKRPRMPG
jgi:glycosyltransferase involved in cell wall biosynthesis